MESHIYSLLIAFFFILLLLKHFSSHQTHNPNPPPSPPPLPLIGHLHLISNPLHLSLASLSSRYGPIFAFRLGRASFLLVSSPSAVEECFTMNDVVFANRPKSMAGDHLSYNYTAYAWSSYGHQWRTLRRLSVVELFSSHSLRKSARIREEEIHKLARQLHKVCKDSKQRVDLNHLISAYSFNVVMRGIAGKPLIGEEEIGSEEGKETLKRTRAIFSASLSLGMCDYFPILRWIGYKGMEKDLVSMSEKRDEFLQRLVDEIRSENKVTEGRRKGNLIETLLYVQEEEPELYTIDVIKSILVVMMTAGTETSAVTLEWAVSRLLSQPSELQKLRREIDERVGHERLLNDSDLAELPYLRCVVDETLRLHPAAPLLLPHVASEGCEVGGYSIPKGTILMVNAWAMHRDPSLWDEPDRFVPERFRVPEMDKGYKFMPFGIGRRACPAAGMALRTVSLALGVFVQCFEWERPLEDTEVDFTGDLRVTLRKAKPLEAVCIVRGQASHLLSKN